MPPENHTTVERLASLEAKVEILLDLLKEIRDDLKNNPTKEEFNTLQDRVKTLEENQSKYGYKIAWIAGAISVVTSVVAAIVSHLATH